MVHLSLIRVVSMFFYVNKEMKLISFYFLRAAFVMNVSGNEFSLVYLSFGNFIMFRSMWQV